MSWYYAGPDAKPVGPVSLEELHAQRLAGTITSETYVLEQTGHTGLPLAWKHYRELFTHPPLPRPPLLPVTAGPAATTHKVPSPAALPGHPAATPASSPYFPSAHRIPPVVSTRPPRPVNQACAWGFGLGLASVLLIFACGLGSLLSLPAIFLSILGLVQVSRHREMAGRGRAIAGLILAGLTLLLSVILLLVMMVSSFKQHEQTTTEQTTE